MKRILYTQRVMEKKEYQERWDCTDRRIPKFISECGYCPMPVPNIPELAGMIIAETKPNGLLLTGGNTLAKYGGDAPERAETERALVRACIGDGIPVFGICRGMQFLLDYFNVPLVSLEGHVAVRHEIHGNWGQFEVNSYHSMGARDAGATLTAAMWAEDGTVEAVEAPEHGVMAVMWHPERVEPFSGVDIQRVRRLFG